MGLPAAACIDDDIVHSSLLSQCLKVATTVGTGLLVGVAIGAAAVAIVGTGGLGAVVLGAVAGAVIGLVADKASEALTGKSLEDAIAAPIMSAIDRLIPGEVKGQIVTGSPTVRINSKKAARAAGKPSAAPPPPHPPMTWWQAAADAVASIFDASTPPDAGFTPVDMDKVACKKHPPAPDRYIAQGSGKVFINGQPAARVGDKTTCGAVLSVAPGRRGNVAIGGGQVTVRAIDSEMPGWLGFIAKWGGFVLAVCQAARGRGPLLRKVLCLGTNFAIAAAADIGVRAAAGAAGQALGGSKGHPVHLPTGNKVLDGTLDEDFAVPARLPLGLVRRYSAANPHAGLFGRGWTTPWDTQLHLHRADILGLGDAAAAHALLDEQGRWLPLPALQPDERFHLVQEGLTFARTGDAHYLLMRDDGLVLDFGDAAPGEAPQVLRLQLVEDPFCNRHHLRWDDAQRLVRVTSSCGQALRLHYAADARQPERIELHPADAPDTPLLLARYTYTAAGQLAEVFDALGECPRRFGYDAQGLMNWQVLPTGLRIEYAWARFPQAPQPQQVAAAEGGHWRVVAWRTSLGEVVTLHYALEARQARAVTEAPGVAARTEHWQWDEDQQVTAYTDALGQTTTLDWHPDQRLLSALHAPGGVTCRFAYDERGNLAAVEDPLGRRTTTVWHERLALPVQRRHPGGREEHWVYDAQGGLVEHRAQPADAAVPALVQRWVLDEHGQAIAHTDARGGVQHQAYTRHGLLRQAIDCSKQSTHWHWGLRGELLAHADALAQRTEWHCDALGQPLAQRGPDGSVQRWQWSPAGQVLAHHDGEGHVRRWRYDAQGQLTSEQDALGQTTTLQPNALGELQQLSDPAGNTTRFEHDGGGRLVAQTASDGLRTEYTLDAQGWPIQVREAAGRAYAQTTQLQRDALGRLLAQRTPRTLTRYTHGPADELLSIERWAADPEDPDLTPQPGWPQWDAHRFGYDAHGRLSEEHACHWAQTPVGTPQPDAPVHRTALRHQHDALGVRTATTLPQGATLNHLHYGSGHLHQINLDGCIVCDLERDALHRETQRSQGVLRTRWQRDALGRPLAQLCSQGEAVAPPRPEAAWAGLLRPEILAGGRFGLQSKAWRWDARGELVARMDPIQGEQHYGYDPAGRITDSRNTTRENLPALDLDDVYPVGQHPRPHLVKQPAADWREHFDWDAASNPVGGGAGSQGRVQHNRLLVYQDQRYAYDGFGRLVDKRVGPHTVQRLYWNEQHQLTEVDTRHGAQTSTTRFSYDALGRRIGKQTATGSVWFVWEGMRLIQELHPQRVTTLVYEPDSYVPMARIDTVPPAMRDIEAANDSRPGFASQAPTKPRLYWFHTSPNGTPEELTDEDGRTVWRGRCKSWGNLALQDTPHARDDRFAQPVFDDQPLRFQGQYADEDTGLHYNTFRYYDADCGRFISQDPIGLAGGFNLYQYAPNAIAWIDPWGWSCISSLPKLRGMSIKRIQGILRKNGFTRRNPGNLRNQRWVHSDGSEVQIHAYGNMQTSRYKAGNNAHIHKSIGKHGEPGTVELADDGVTQVRINSSEAHIGIRNPSDFEGVSGRPHGAGQL